MTRIQTLSDLQPGQSATVRSVCAPDGMQRRLRDLGLIEQTRVVCLGRSPMGDPSAYLIRGTVIALRRCAARSRSWPNRRRRERALRAGAGCSIMQENTCIRSDRYGRQTENECG